jgi:hypothetical protein
VGSRQSVLNATLAFIYVFVSAIFFPSKRFQNTLLADLSIRTFVVMSANLTKLEAEFRYDVRARSEPFKPEGYDWSITNGENECGNDELSQEDNETESVLQELGELHQEIRKAQDPRWHTDHEPTAIEDWEVSIRAPSSLVPVSRIECVFKTFANHHRLHSMSI